MTKPVTALLERLNLDPSRITGRGLNYVEVTEGNRKQRIVSGEPLFFERDGQLVDIDIDWYLNRAGIWTVRSAPYRVEVRNLFTAPVLLASVPEGNQLVLQLQPLTYEARSDTLLATQTIAQPAPVQATAQGNVLTFHDAFGPGIDFLWYATPAGLRKAVRFRDPSLLPEPSERLRDVAGLGHATELAVRFDVRAASGNFTSDANDGAYLELEGRRVMNFSRPHAEDSLGELCYGHLRIDQSNPKQRSLATAFSLDELRDETMSYPLLVDPTVELQMAAGADDGYVDLKATGTGVGATDFILTVGLNSSTVGPFLNFLRFSGISLPSQYVVFDNVQLGLYNQGTSAPGPRIPNPKFTAEPIDNPTAPTLRSDLVNRARTPTSVVWNMQTETPGITESGWHLSANLSPIMQELYNTGKLTSGVVLFFMEDEDPNQTVLGRWRFRTKNHTSGNHPYMVFTYHEEVPVQNDKDLNLLPAAQSNAEGFVNSSSTGVNINYDSNVLGDNTSGVYDHESWTYFSALNVSRGASIGKANVTVVPRGSISSRTPLRIHAVKSLNPTIPTSKADFNALPLTQAFVTWKPPSWTAETPITSIDFSAVIAEIVNQTNWQPGKPLMLVYKDPYPGDQSASYSIMQWYREAHAPGKGTVLNVVWGEHVEISVQTDVEAIGQEATRTTRSFRSAQTDIEVSTRAIASGRKQQQADTEFDLETTARAAIYGSRSATTEVEALSTGVETVHIGRSESLTWVEDIEQAALPHHLTHTATLTEVDALETSVAQQSRIHRSSQTDVEEFRTELTLSARVERATHTEVNDLETSATRTVLVYSKTLTEVDGASTSVTTTRHGEAAADTQVEAPETDVTHTVRVERSAQTDVEGLETGTTAWMTAHRSVQTDVDALETHSDAVGRAHLSALTEVPEVGTEAAWVALAHRQAVTEVELGTSAAAHSVAYLNGATEFDIGTASHVRGSGYRLAETEFDIGYDPDVRHTTFAELHFDVEPVDHYAVARLIAGLDATTDIEVETSASLEVSVNIAAQTDIDIGTEATREVRVYRSATTEVDDLETNAQVTGYGFAEATTEVVDLETSSWAKRTGRVDVGTEFDVGTSATDTSRSELEATTEVELETAAPTTSYRELDAQTDIELDTSATGTRYSFTETLTEVEELSQEADREGRSERTSQTDVEAVQGANITAHGEREATTEVEVETSATIRLRAGSRFAYTDVEELETGVSIITHIERDTHTGFEVGTDTAPYSRNFIELFNEFDLEQSSEARGFRSRSSHTHVEPVAQWSGRESYVERNAYTEFDVGHSSDLPNVGDMEESRSDTYMIAPDIDTVTVYLRGRESIKTLQKDPQATIARFFNWRNYLAEKDVALRSATVFCESDDLLISNVSYGTDGLVRAIISGGHAGNTYKVTCRIEMETGETDDRSLWLAINEL